MTCRFRHLPVLLTLSALLLTAELAAQDSAPAPQTRESMWWPPTAEDWARPCLITFQRTYDDALKVAKATGKAILICVNMDGEPASEHYAGVRYRHPETAALYAPYVAVMASVYRHTPRDYDEQGNRVLCPRFGSVTCGEHIAIEPALFEQFFDGKRVAPRHIMIEPEKASAEVYDIFYAFDTDTIFNSLKDGIANRPPPLPIARGDRTLIERVGSADIEDRTAVENAYKKGDASVRRMLIEAAAKHRDLNETEILRLALFGFDLELARLARRTLAQSTAPEAVELIAEALRVPMDVAEREALVAALVRLAESSPRAQTLAAVYQGLAARSDRVDVGEWAKALKESREVVTASDSYAIGARLEGNVHASNSKPVDPAARLALAESYLELASHPETSAKFARLMLEDARVAALDAEKLGASGWTVDSILAVTAADLGNREEAELRAEAAMQALPADAQSATAGRVLLFFAQARQRAIWVATRERKPWPPQYLTDVHAAYSVLARHPSASDRHVASHFDFLRNLSAVEQANQVLDAGLSAFPDSFVLHDRLRTRLLDERGVAGLESGYAERLADPQASANLAWYAGYASIVAAEFFRRDARPAEALGAYERAMAHYEVAAARNSAGRDSADHYIALALAGRARVEFEGGNDAKAVADLCASFVKKPTAAATLDGLNLSPVDTAKMVRERLRESKQTELELTLQAALDALDPQMLRLPAYERQGPANTPPGNRPRNRREPSGGR